MKNANDIGSVIRGGTVCPTLIRSDDASVGTTQDAKVVVMFFRCNSSGRSAPATESRRERTRRTDRMRGI